MKRQPSMIYGIKTLYPGADIQFLQGQYTCPVNVASKGNVDVRYGVTISMTDLICSTDLGNATWDAVRKNYQLFFPLMFEVDFYPNKSTSHSIGGASMLWFDPFNQPPSIQPIAGVEYLDTKTIDSTQPCRIKVGKFANERSYTTSLTKYPFGYLHMAHTITAPYPGPAEFELGTLVYRVKYYCWGIGGSAPPDMLLTPMETMMQDFRKI